MIVQLSIRKDCQKFGTNFQQLAPIVNVVDIVNIVNIVLVCSTALARIAAAALFCQISQGAHLRYSLLLRSPLASVLHIRIKKKQRNKRATGNMT